MESIRELYKAGRGPSSSHTMGPFKAATQFCAQHPSADHFRVVLYGSLALTGKGHMTDAVILEALGGGGNSTTAGGRVENTDAETVQNRLHEAIDAYFEK